MGKTKFYVVWEGLNPGIYKSWAECEAQVKGVKGSRYKAFPTEKEAKEAFDGPQVSEAQVSKKASSEKSTIVKAYSEKSISVDAACSGNPGPLEFQGVDTKTGEQLFLFGPYPLGTNNIGEFLGIVEGLKLLQQRGDEESIIYTDSVTAIAWVRNKKVSTNLVRNKSTEKVWTDIENAIEWLKTNSYKNSIQKWLTKEWGEIKADFGRK